MKPVSILAALSALFTLNAEAKKYVLFLCSDDLRPELGCYGAPLAKTPNLDKLAAEGVLFENAYCQQAICSPSRASLMTGKRPDTIGIIENYAHFREENPDIVTLSQYFMANGYDAAHAGKIFHSRSTDDAKFSWNKTMNPALLPYKRKNTPGDYQLEENQQIVKKRRAEMEAKYGKGNTGGLVNGPAYEGADVEDWKYIDGHSTQLAKYFLIDHVKNSPDKPLFLGVGWKKPHLNFLAPKKYWDMYDRKDIQLAVQNAAPEDGASFGLHASFELRTRYGIPKKGPIDEELATTLLHAYYACASMVDAQVGIMLDTLDELGIRDETLIVFWSDHGWHLGDMGVWGKATNYEIATRVPLIAWTPNMPDEVRGSRTDALVELVDLYPTLVEEAGLEVPKDLEGLSFSPLLKDPKTPWKKAAFSQYPNPALREWAANPLSEGMRGTFFGPLIEKVEGNIATQFGENWDRDFFENHLMGYAMRTERYRLVTWQDYRDPSKEPVFIELYDHQKDPDETKNIAKQHPELVKRLVSESKKGWKGALPK